MPEADARDRLAKDVTASLEEQGVSAVALAFVDPSAIVRVKCVPLARFPQVVRSGVGLSTLFDVALSNDHFALLPGFIDGPSGDLRLRPDPASCVALAAMPGWAWSAVDQHTQAGEPFAACPRTFLRRMVERLGALGLRAKAAYEFEFSVGTVTADDGFEPAHHGPGYSDIALAANHEFALEVIEAVEAQGLGVQQFHPEYADGQFELSIAPRDPVEAADASLLVRMTIRAVARRHGWVASFAPVVAAETGNGMHLHLSLWDGETNLLSGGSGPAGMRDRGEAFAAGILEELPATVAVTAPSCLSYLRLQPAHWAGAMRCWGVENREAALRFIAGVSDPAAANLEVKPIDGTANAYLALGSMLAAGIHGVESGATLPPSFEGDPLLASASEREERGIVQLPASLSEAAERLAESAVLKDAMGEFLFETFLATRRGEVAEYAGRSNEELIRALRWRF